MRQRRNICFASFLFLTISLLLSVGPNPEAAQGTKLPQSIYIQAQAMGTSTQLGQTFNVTAIINELSPPEDQKILFDAFQAKKERRFGQCLVEDAFEGTSIDHGHAEWRPRIRTEV